MPGVNAIFYVIVLIMSVVVHEMAHGYAADAQGDPTARFAGRLSLNPLRHIDLVGSLLLPFLLIIMHAGFIIGWAKPVPYDERNLRNKRWGTLFVASAGIISNLALALVFGLSIRLASLFGSAAIPFISIAASITLVNILLALFNLIPIPPLDGSKILFSLLSSKMIKFQSVVEYLSLPLLLVFIVFLWPYVSPLVGWLFSLVTGIGAPLS